VGLLIVGLAFLAGLGLAARLSGKAQGGAPAVSPSPSHTGVGYAPNGEPPKAQPGEVVASFPHGMWGRVIKVNCGADGGFRYVVGLQNGTTVELRGQEMTR
jgi:hypothetical protein